MPYINRKNRRSINKAAYDYWTQKPQCPLDVIGRECECAGDLNYVFCRLVVGYITKKGKTYQNLHDAIGALRDSAEELRRRVLDPYEDSAIEKNGDAIGELI